MTLKTNMICTINYSLTGGVGSVQQIGFHVNHPRRLLRLDLLPARKWNIINISEILETKNSPYLCPYFIKALKKWISINLSILKRNIDDNYNNKILHFLAYQKNVNWMVWSNIIIFYLLVHQESSHHHSSCSTDII